MGRVGSAFERRRELEAAYPAVLALDRATVVAICSRYLARRPLPPHSRSGADILSFGSFVREALSDADALPAYASDLARFVHVLQQVRFAPDSVANAQTAGQGSATLRDRPARAAGVVVEHFSYNVTEIEAALREGRRPNPRAQEDHVVYGRRRDDGQPVALRVSAAAATLVERCDGRQTLGAVIAGAAPSCLRPVMAPGALRAVERLMGVGIFEPLSAPAGNEPP